MIRIINNWIPNPAEVRAAALTRPFAPVGQGGASFPGIQMSDDAPWSRLRELVPDSSPSKQIEFYRLYTPGEPQPTFIHHDLDMGSWSGILYLDDVGGTAFWSPKGADPDPYDVFDWRLETFVAAKPGRLLLFPSHLMHSRWPREFTAPRMIQVFFF